MIRKIALYGLFFKFGITFGDLTQEQLEDFIKVQGDSVEVRSTLLGIPVEITLKDEVSKEAWTDFLSTHTLPIREIPKIPALVPNGFRKYSREASEEERALLKGWGVKNLRVVDFDSIVSSLDEAKKQEVLRLRDDKTVLFEAMGRWVDKISIDNIGSVKVNGDFGICYYPYTLNLESCQNIRAALKDIFTKMLSYRSSCETLILSLVLLPDLQFSVSDDIHLNFNIIEFCFEKYEDYNIAGLYHELNHVLHNKLGLEWYELFTKDLNSKLERGLFRFLEGPVGTNSEQGVQTFLAGHRSEDSLWRGLQKFFKLAQLTLLWSTLEEIWNIIGFANVEDCIYINRMSDMNLTTVPFIFHADGCAFTDCGVLGGFFCKFFEGIRQKVVNNINELCPEADAWGVWCQLQKRVGANFYPINRDSVDDLFKILRVKSFD